MNEEDRKDKKDDDGIISKLKAGARKNNKSKFKMMLKNAPKIIAALIPIIKIMTIVLVAFVITSAISYIIDLVGSANVSDVASKTLIEDFTEIAKKSDEEGYYFKISEELIKNYVEGLNKAYYEGYYNEKDPKKDEDESEDVNDEDIPEYVYDEDERFITDQDIENWFGTKEFRPYLIKMIRAEVASNYPRLGTYEGENGSDDPQGNKRDADRKLCSTRCCTDKKD